MTHNAPKTILKFAVMILMTTATVALLVAVIVRSVSGPQHPGPGNNPDAFAVVFLDDLGQPIKLSSCNNPPSCSSLNYTYSISNGSKDTENIGTDVKSTWLITEQSGTNFRKCLTLLYPNYVSHPKIRLSKATNCSG
jgi:hypothetical protein